MGKVSATTYLVLEPTHDFSGKATGLRVDRIVQSRPTKLNSRHVAVQLRITIDSSVFEQFLPEVDVSIGGRGELLTPVVDVIPPADPEQTPAGDDPTP